MVTMATLTTKLTRGPFPNANKKSKRKKEPPPRPGERAVRRAAAFETPPPRAVGQKPPLLCFVLRCALLSWLRMVARRGLPLFVARPIARLRGGAARLAAIYAARVRRIAVGKCAPPLR